MSKIERSQTKLVSRINQEYSKVAGRLGLGFRDMGFEAMGPFTGGTFGRLNHVFTSPTTPDIYTDSNILEQVLLNLVRNALQASDHRQTIHIKARREQKQLQFIITDTGSGIPKEELERIFEPFYTTREKGSGLGLAITKRLLDQLGGDIRIASREGSGTEVFFWIPFYEKQP